MADEPAARITLREIWDQGQKTQAQVTALETKVDNFTSVHERLDSHKADIADHDFRLRKIESRVSALSVIIGLITTGIGALLAKFFGS